jgi:hypothetical protein
VCVHSVCAHWQLDDVTAAGEAVVISHREVGAAGVAVQW